ncbi:histidine kinase [Kineococcus sp. NUM-3379]
MDPASPEPPRGAATARAVAAGGAAIAAATTAVVLTPASVVLVAPAALWLGLRVRDGRGATVAAALAVAVAVGFAGVLAPGARAVTFSTLQTLLVWAVVPWLLGRAWAQRRRLLEAQWETVERVERERRLVAQEARLRERTRIAEDVHDGLGHDLSLIALRAGALELDAALPPAQRRAAAELRVSAAAAVERLGAVVGLLREEGTPAPLGTGTSVAGLVGGARASGMDVTLHGADPADDLLHGSDPAVAAAATRIVQESLTNAARHAPGAPVDVRVERRGDRLAVEVVSGPAAGEPAGGGGGRGLHALRERARLVGGRLEAGPLEAGVHGSGVHGSGTPEGGFAVRADLPVRATGPARPDAPPADVPAPGAPGADLVRRLRLAQQRASRRLAVAVAVPVGAVLLLAAALQTDTLVATHRSVLPRADYERLRVGQPATEVVAWLPGDQVPRLSPGVEAAAAADPAPAGSVCVHHAVTADLLSDRAGDVYRLCFRGDRLVSKDLLADAGGVP